MHDVFEASYFIVDHEFMSNYLLHLITDMRDILTRLDVEHDLIRIEIYKPPDFNTYFERYIDEIVPAHIRRLFLTQHFPFAEFLVAFFHHIRRVLYQFFRFQLRFPAHSNCHSICYCHYMFRERFM